MSIRRYYIPNAIIFITQIVDRRLPIFAQVTFVELLRQNLHETQTHHPFAMIGYSFLPDHFHIMIRPTGTSSFSDMMHSLKPNFTKAYKAQVGISGSMKFWQKGFWDHLIRDERDFERHLDYIHYNPVKHGLVTKPEDWPHSSFASWKQKGVYPERWGWALPQSLSECDWAEAEKDRGNS